MSHVSSLNGLTGNLTVEDIGLSGVTTATASATAISTDVTADTQKRLVVQGDGKHIWGSGSATGDTNLYRSAADTLKTDDAFLVAGTLGVTGATTLSSTLASGALTVTGAASTTTTVTAGTAITATLGDITATNGNIVAGTAGKGLQVKTGSNAKAGTGVSNGTSAVTISTTAVTANSLIFIGYNTPAGTPAPVYVSAVTPGTSFQTKSSASDTSTFAWMIVEPAA